MKRIDGWDNIQAAGEFEALELGGHICKILKAESVTTSTKKEALQLYFDVAEGKQAGYFKKRFSEDNRQDRKWPNGGQYRQLTEGNSQRFFKGMIAAIEKSNPGFKWDWDEKKLEGKLFGGVFGREQYQAADGSLKFATKCFSIRSVDVVRAGVPVPQDKLAPGNHTVRDDDFTAMAPISDDDLPF